ncbi:MAG: FkbM family methyltransferase [Planctomycetota bacterium]|jgi:FkbM family methyltransferase|nr:FkbM family methyltransferase [Planctomycetota bacterium]
MLHRMGLRSYRETEISLEDGLRLFARAGTHDEVVKREIWDERIYPIDEVELAAGDSVVDVGAQIGAFSLLASRMPVTVFAYEPSPMNYALLERNVAANGLEDRVHAFPLAVQRPGVRELLLSQSYTNTGGHTSMCDLGPCRRVEAVSLDVVLARHGLDRCQVVKIDTEGAEYDIVYGCPPATLDAIENLFAEVHEHPLLDDCRRSDEPPYTREGMRGFLTDRGFDVRVDHRTYCLWARR